MPLLTSSAGSPSLPLIRLSRDVVAWTLGLAYATLPLSGVAQESSEDADQSLDLGTITVTGQKAERSLAETDGSVTVIFPGESEGPGGAAYDVFGVAERLANVMPFAGGSGVAIRGIGQTGFSSGPTFGQTNYLVTRSPGDLVATYMDGIPVSVYAGPLGGLWDVDQVEVLRGAQSTVLGRGSLGGAVVIENADPTFTQEAVGKLSFGTNGAAPGASFAVSGPIVEDRFAYRVAFDRQRGPSFIENITLNSDGDLRQILSRRVKFLYEGQGGQEIELSTVFSEASVGTVYVDVDEWNNGNRVTRADLNTDLNNHVGGASLRGSWPLSDRLSLESATVWVEEDATQDLDVDQTETQRVVTPIGVALTPADPSDDTRENSGQFDDDIRTVSQELRLRYTGDNLSGFIGAYYEAFEGIAGTKSPVFGEKTIQQSVQTVSLFGEGKWSISDKLDLTFGLRAEQERNETDVSGTVNDLDSARLLLGTSSAAPQLLQTCQQNPQNPVCVDQGITNALQSLARDFGRPVSTRSDQDFSMLLPKLGLSYAATPQTRFYGTVQRGYRAGGAGVTIINAKEFEFDPETTWNVDLGVRHNSADGRLRLSSNIFYVDWQDQQLQIPVEGGAVVDFESVNAGQSQTYGMELDVDYQTSHRLRLFGTVGLLKTEIQEAPDAQADWIGNSFTMAPEATVSAGLHYDFDNGLDFSLATNWRDSFFSDIENSSNEEVESRFLVDMGVGYDFPDRDLRLDFTVTNLFDEQYINHSYAEALSSFANDFNTLPQVLIAQDPRLAQLYGPNLVDTSGIVAPGPGRAVTISLTGRF